MTDIKKTCQDNLVKRIINRMKISQLELQCRTHPVTQSSPGAAWLELW